MNTYNINNSFSFSIDIDKNNNDTNDIRGYFNFSIDSQIFGDNTILTYLEMILGQLEKTFNKKNTSYKNVFEGKNDSEIFNLIYKLTRDLDFNEEINDDQQLINLFYFRDNIFRCESSLDFEIIYIYFKDNNFHFLCKHFDDSANIYEQELITCSLSDVEMKRFIQKLYELLPRVRDYEYFVTQLPQAIQTKLPMGPDGDLGLKGAAGKQIAFESFPDASIPK